jgi:hypothetical protein
MKDEVAETVGPELQGELTPVDEGADIVDGVEMESVPEKPGKATDAAQEPPQPIGDVMRWKRMDDTNSIAYEIKDRGVIVRSWGCLVFVPATKLVSDVNNGWRIVAA